MQAMAESSLKIAENPLNSRQVRFARIMHVKAYLLNSISNVWSCESKVLQGSCKTAIVGRISDRSTFSSRNFSMSVHRRATQFAIHHTSMFEDVNGVLLTGRDHLNVA